MPAHSVSMRIIPYTRRTVFMIPSGNLSHGYDRDDDALYTPFAKRQKRRRILFSSRYGEKMKNRSKIDEKFRSILKIFVLLSLDCFSIVENRLKLRVIGARLQLL